MSDETDQGIAQQPVAAPSNPEEPKTLVYCGPTLPALRQYQIFAGGLHESIQKLIEECKPLGVLLVPPVQVAVTRIALTQKGSVESNMYQAVQAYFKSRKE